VIIDCHYADDLGFRHTKISYLFPHSL